MRAMQALRWAFFAAALIGIGVLASAEPDGASRLVSVQQLPDNLGVCTTWDQPGAPAPIDSLVAGANPIRRPAAGTVPAQDPLHQLARPPRSRMALRKATLAKAAVSEAAARVLPAEEQVSFSPTPRSRRE